MKIVFATDDYFPIYDGVAIATRRLAQQLSLLGNEVFVIAPSKTNRDEVYKDGRIIIYGIASFYTPVHNYLRLSPYMLSKNKVYRILKKISPDVIHIQTWAGVGKSASLYAKECGIATLATYHTIAEAITSSASYPVLLKEIVKKIYWQSFASFWKDTDLLTTPSADTVDYILKNSGLKKEISIISNGVDLHKFRGHSKNVDNEPLLLVVGRLDPGKRVDVVIKAMPQILKHIRVKLVIIGTGPERNTLEKLVLDLGIKRSVSFVGFVPEEMMASYYGKADIFVTGSVYENQSLAILEAMSSSLPIVATKGIVTGLIKNGKNGYRFNPGDFSTLAGKIVKILSNKKLATKMGRESAKLVQEHDIREVAIKMQNLYQRAMAINSLRTAYAQQKQSFISRGFAVKVALVVFLLAVLFRNSLTSPEVARAKGIHLRKQIADSKVVRDIANFDQRLKTTFEKNK